VDKERPYVLFLALVEFLAVNIAQPFPKALHNHFVRPDSGSRLVEIPILHRRIDGIDFLVTVRRRLLQSRVVCAAFSGHWRTGSCCTGLSGQMRSAQGIIGRTYGLCSLFVVSSCVGTFNLILI
jgi:hypothetical protein